MSTSVSNRWTLNHLSQTVIYDKDYLQRLNSAGNQLMLEAHDWENETQQMHLECAAREVAGNIVEADDWITHVKYTVRHGGSTTCIVHAGHDCVQHSFLNLSIHPDRCPVISLISLPFWSFSTCGRVNKYTLKTFHRLTAFLVAHSKILKG